MVDGGGCIPPFVRQGGATIVIIPLFLVNVQDLSKDFISRSEICRTIYAELSS